MGEPGAIDVIATAARLAVDVSACADETEHGRRLPRDLVDAFAGAGLFRMAVPAAYGGLEASAADLLQAIEVVSEADGATGWCLMIGATTGAAAALLPADVAVEIYGSDPLVVTGGVFAPHGRAQRVEGGYRVTGRWPFASGCEHCAWLSAGVVVDGDPPGPPRLLYFPASDVEIIDTWTVSGMEGTGSHDIAVHDVFVPAGREVVPGIDRPQVDGRLYRFPVFGLLALGVGAVALGIGRAAINELVGMAAGKTPTGGRRTLAERPVVQTEVAQAEAALRGARALFYDSVNAAWDGKVDVPSRTAVRLAATHAVSTAADVTLAMYRAGGGSAIYRSNRLQRCFRDANVITQHMIVAPATWELEGRLLLGVPTDTTLL